MHFFYSFLLLCCCAACGSDPKNKADHASIKGDSSVSTAISYSTIGTIPEPNGYHRAVVGKESFASWLRTVKLKKDKTVFLYNGKPKSNQSAQFAVIDIPTGNKDLQQCADAVMRMRAEYLFATKKYDQIAFMDYNKKWYAWKGGSNRSAFDNYLQTVFGWCGSASLEKQMNKVKNFNDLDIGDVFVQGGFPGHAMLVADMAINQKGEKVYLLLQGYQPAQDIHIVINPNDRAISPWYRVDMEGDIITPEWTFNKVNLERW